MTMAELGSIAAGGLKEATVPLTSKGTFLETYERQVEWYLEQFVIPEDYQQRILDMYSNLSTKQQDVDKSKATLDGTLQRAKDLYAWGDISREEYQAQRDAILIERREFAPELGSEQILERLADFLKHVAEGWRAAGQEQRNRLARALFEEITVQDQQVVAVRPTPELAHFFRISFECQRKSIAGDPDRIRTGDLCLDRAVC